MLKDILPCLNKVIFLSFSYKMQAPLFYVGVGNIPVDSPGLINILSAVFEMFSSISCIFTLLCSSVN